MHDTFHGPRVSTEIIDQRSLILQTSAWRTSSIYNTNLHEFSEKTIFPGYGVSTRKTCVFFN